MFTKARVCLTSMNFNARFRFLSTVKMSKKSPDLSGIFVAVPTPFMPDSKQSINYEKLRFNLEKWEKIPMKGYCLGGTNGEWPYLTKEERISLIEETKKTVSADKIIIAGTTCESTEETCKLSATAFEAGADVVLVMAPFYFKSRTSIESIGQHFKEVADRSLAPVVIYNNPMTTGIDIPVRAIQQLADHPNIIGIKDCDVTKLGMIVQCTKGKNFAVFAGSSGYLLPSLMMGCTGGINALPAILGQYVCEMYELAEQNKWEEAMSLQQKLVRIDFLLMRELGPPGLKAAMNILGYYGGVCRRPLLPITEKEQKLILDVLEDDGFFIEENVDHKMHQNK